MGDLARRAEVGLGLEIGLGVTRTFLREEMLRTSVTTSGTDSISYSVLIWETGMSKIISRPLIWLPRSFPRWHSLIRPNPGKLHRGIRDPLGISRPHAINTILINRPHPANPLTNQPKLGSSR